MAVQMFRVPTGLRELGFNGVAFGAKTVGLCR